MTWAYDDGDRVTSVDPPLVPPSTTAYDVWDNVTSTTNANSETTAYQVDKAGRVTRVTDPLNHAAYLEYDKNGNRTALTDPRGNTQTISVACPDEGGDALSRPIGSHTAPATTMAGNVAARTASATYALDGPVVSETDFNGQTRSYAYDTARRLKTFDHPGTTPDVGYVWDKLGRRTSMSEGGSTVATYSYDEWERLVAETRGSSVIGYRYDRRHQTRVTYPDGKAISSTFDAAGQLTSLDDWRGNPDGRTTFTYDGAGRRETRTLPNSVFTRWTFDAADRLTEVEHQQFEDGPVLFRATSTYDNVGRRLTQTDDARRAARAPCLRCRSSCRRSGAGRPAVPPTRCRRAAAGARPGRRTACPAAGSPTRPARRTACPAAGSSSSRLPRSRRSPTTRPGGCSPKRATARRRPPGSTRTAATA